MPDKIAGWLEVGVNDRHEVVINHPQLETDENGAGYLVFSPDQARNLARLLNNKADEAEGVYTLPETCAWCGVVLMGGATQHKPGCAILAMIAEAEGAVQ